MKQIGQAMGMANQLYSQTAGRVQAPTNQNMMMSASQIAELDQRNNEQQWNRDWLASQTAAAPDPAAVGVANFNQTPEGKMQLHGQNLRTAQERYQRAYTMGGSLAMMESSRNLDYQKRISGLI